MRRSTATDRGRTGLHLFAGCALTQAVLAVVPRLLSAWSLSALRAEGGGFSDFSWNQYLFPVFQGLGWLCTLGMAWGLWLYAATFERGKAALARSALALYGVQALWEAFYLTVHIAQLSGVRIDPESWDVVWPILFWSGFAAEIAALICLLLAIAGRQRAAAGPPLTRPMAAAIAGAILMYAFNLVLATGVFDRAFRVEHPWLHFSVASAFSLAFAAALFFLVLTHGRSAARAPVPAMEPSAPGTEFPAGVGRGLSTYRTALLWRLGITVGGMILILLAQFGRSLPAMKFFLVASSLLSLGCGAFMLAGMARFATSLPGRTRARAPAALGLSVMVAGTFLDLAATALVFGIFSSRISTVMSAVKTAPWLSLAGQILALVGMVALLLAFLRLGQALDMERIRERVGRIGWMLGFTIPLAVLAQLLLRFTRIGPVAGLFLAGTVLVLAIVTLILFLGLLNRLILRLQDNSPPAA